MTDQVLQDDELRFVDVLLEEELGAGADGLVPAVAPRPRQAWWLAALVVLGLGVTVGSAVLQRLGTDPVPLQEPVRRVVPFVPNDAKELAKFLQQVAMVRVQPLHALLRGFGARLETLAIIGDHLAPFPVAESLLPTIAQLPKLAELHLAVDGEDSAQFTVRDWDHESIVATVLSMPSLRRLAFTARNSDVSRWWPALARTRLEKLRLPGVELDAAAVAQLAAMTSLRELDLRGVTMAADAHTALAQLGQLTRLDVGWNGWNETELQTLRLALPRCSVRGGVGVRGAAYPGLGVEPSWSREESIVLPLGSAK